MTWPADFEGVYEPDYYAEALTKRLLAAAPSLAEGLSAPEMADPGGLDAALLVGDYVREPVLNEWHQVTITLDGADLRWVNAAGVSWSLSLGKDGLWAGPDCPYGEQQIPVQVDDGGVVGLWFGGELYGRVQ